MPNWTLWALVAMWCCLPLCIFVAPPGMKRIDPVLVTWGCLVTIFWMVFKFWVLI